MNKKLEISQEIFRRMNESGQTNYLHSLFLNLSVEKIVQSMNDLGNPNSFSLLFPLRTKPNSDQDEIKRWHIANNIVFLFLQKHNMDISIRTASLEFSSEYIQNKDEKDLKAVLHCPKSESVIQSLIKYNLFQSNNNAYSSYISNNNSVMCAISKSNNKKVPSKNNSKTYPNASYNSNSFIKNIISIDNSNNGSNTSSNESDNIKCNNTNYNSIDNYTNTNENNNFRENVNISINRFKKKSSKSNRFNSTGKSVQKIKKKKKIETLEQGTKSPKKNRVTIMWDKSKTGSNNTSYIYNTYDNSGSENYQYYDSICYESEETKKNEMKILNNSNGTVRKVDLLKNSIFNFNNSKLEELLEIKRQNLSSKMFSYQITATIIEAKDLTIIDFLSSLDPFCTIQYDMSDIFKTKVNEDTKTPVWNSTFRFITQSLDDNSHLTFEVYDSDPLGTDKKLSSLEIYLFEVMDSLTINRWFEMKSDTIFKLQPQLHLNINVDLIEKEKQDSPNNQDDLESPDSYNYDLDSNENYDQQPSENKLYF